MTHGLATNRDTANLVVRLTDRDGVVGFGEGVPRSYVTGESLEGSQEFLTRRAPGLLLGRAIDSRRVMDFCREVIDDESAARHPAAVCALETALLDLAGRRRGLPCSALLAPGRGEPAGEVIYSVVVPIIDQPEAREAVLEAIAAAGFRQVKVKLGFAGDMEHLAWVRRRLGPEVDIRVDVNGAWSREQALGNLEQLALLGVSVLEQPVDPRDAEAWEAIAGAGDLRIMADESLCSLADARRLIAQGAVGAFNLKLSKLAGFGRCREIMEMAHAHGLAVQLGCQVGELGILSAAGRHFAAAAGGLLYLEGSLTRFFTRDIIAQDLTPGAGGRAPVLAGPGLGIDVDQSQLSAGG